MRGAEIEARTLGYHAVVLDRPIVGESRLVGRSHVEHVLAETAGLPRPLCVISSGETTVTVTGSGRGGRNQELALAAAESLAASGCSAALASAGTDGVDGPTDAAGAIADSTTLARARAAQLSAPDTYLDANDSYRFFAALGDLIQTGPTGTNVGDLQILLVL
jgi:hydroxypyruvate reductase